ncbi:CBS domain-containing protein [Salinibacillus kushneri]|uniref:CBS domain-containing protein n=1 Tax=Salinibacillus kushneri TaxID=237682 RepID=A0A1I0HRV3_9BACI|nr:CBS domain-containing protein [Salinibacillus kushneri]SET86030.1 CBS domain-containing protein [Salinibacillus kushneri]
MKSIRDIMTRDVSSCSPDDTLYDAAMKMKELDVGVIPVTDNQNHLMGLVTDRDLVLRGYANKKSESTKIQDVISDDLYSVSPETDVQEASQVMAEKQIRRLPVVDNGELVGIVSLGDLSLEKKSDHAAGVALNEISEKRDELH